MRVEVSYVSDWELRDKEDVHPYERVAVIPVGYSVIPVGYSVIPVGYLLELIKTVSEEGNGARVFLKDLRRELERIERWG